jgi:predicted metal-dependent peptidase
MIGKATWEKMTLRDRITAAHTDIMNHPEFALLSGVILTGKVEISDKIPTAATNGRDVKYGDAFMTPLNQKQVRYLVLHENGHKALKHCVWYRDIVRKYPRLSNIAQDYVINGMIEELDPDLKFVERPTEGLCIDPKYFGWGWIEVLQDLLKNGGEGGGSGGDGNPDPFDEHEDGSEVMEADEIDSLSEEIDEALRQGKIIVDRKRGEGSGKNPLNALIQPRETNWRDAMREFIETICTGHDNSRFCPPNKRLLASGFIMPSHFSESAGELIVACDTSGSMTGVYPVVFGEIARICETVRPESVRVLWWDSEVCGEQVFTEQNYNDLASLLKPAGGGGTYVTCVAEYIRDKEYKPKAVIYLTDGYIESSYALPEVPCLWGVVDNKQFVPQRGKKLNINSLSI